LQASIVETTNELKKENEQLQDQVKQLLHEKKDLLEKNNDILIRLLFFFESSLFGLVLKKILKIMEIHLIL